MNDATRKLDNLTNALVEDILKAPDEEVLADALIALVQKERARADAAEARAQRARAEALLEFIDVKRFDQAPCYICGYNGPNYYQPATHECAKAFHRARNKELDDPSTEETT